MIPRGPHTPEGKFTSSQNSTTHGMCQERFLLLPGESREAFEALLADYRSQYSLEDDPAVPHLVTTLAERDWLQQRCTYRICRLEAELAEAEDANDTARIDYLEKRLHNAYRYKTAAENSFKRAFQMLERFRHTRIAEQQSARRVEIQEFTAVERALVAREKHGIPPDTSMELRTNEEEFNPDDENENAAGPDETAPSPDDPGAGGD